MEKVMDTKVVRYTHDYEDDTKLTWTLTADGSSSIELLFISEDYDAGAESMVFGGMESETLEELAEALLEEISYTLDTEYEYRKPKQENLHEEYTKTALIAWEAILKKIVNKEEK